MKVEYEFHKIDIDDSSSTEIVTELYKRKMQLSIYNEKFTIEKLRKYITELEEQKKKLDLIPDKTAEPIDPFYKVLMIISLVLLLIFGVGSIYIRNSLLSFIAFLDLLIGLFAFYNYKEQRSERRIEL